MAVKYSPIIGSKLIIQSGYHESDSERNRKERTMATGKRETVEQMCDRLHAAGFAAKADEFRGQFNAFNDAKAKVKEHLKALRKNVVKAVKAVDALK
jgi:hypothetical protein